MRKSFDDYTMLHNGRHKGSLWLGADHLLIIEKMSLFGTLRESYRRIDYDRIQAVLVARTRASLYTSIALGVFVAILGLAGFGAWKSDMIPLLWIYGVMLMLALVILAFHLSRGPSAALIVRTAVRPWKLAPVRLLRDAEKVSEALSARCVEFQGGDLAAAEGLADTTDANLAAPPPLPVSMIPVDEDTIPPHASIGWGYVCLALFGLMIAGEVYLDEQIYTYGLLAAGAGALVLLAVGVSRRGGLVSTGSRACWFVAAVLLGIAGLSGYGIAMVTSVAGQIKSGIQPDLVRCISSFPPTPESGGAIFLLALGSAMLVVAIFGLAAAARRRRSLQAVDAAANRLAANSGNFP